jgi:siderophore synthetase component
MSSSTDASEAKPPVQPEQVSAVAKSAESAVSTPPAAEPARPSTPDTATPVTPATQPVVADQLARAHADTPVAEAGTAVPETATVPEQSAGAEASSAPLVSAASEAGPAEAPPAARDAAAREASTGETATRETATREAPAPAVEPRPTSVPTAPAAQVAAPQPTPAAPPKVPERAPATEEPWRLASRRLLAKTLSEFCYEELLVPSAVGDGRYRVSVAEHTSYTFRADRGVYGSWFVDPDSIRRTRGGETAIADDVLDFVAESHEALGVPGDTAAHLIRELAATLAADVRLARTALPAARLADLPYAELEGYQTGHPWIVFNKGRVGFSASDTTRYAPEARQPTRLPWVAVRDDLATFRAIDPLDPSILYREELDPATRSIFASELVRLGFNPAAYWWLPVHPWQWDEYLQPLYGPDIAAGRIVPLGAPDDRYLPQQSIRTFTNVSTPARRSIKLPLSVLNTMVWRGLPTERTLAAPAVTQWLLGKAANDPYLRDETRVILLGEVASVAVGHPVFDRLKDAPYQYRELFGAIWRDPMFTALDPGEHARTLASLLYVDPSGKPLVAELVRRSGLDATSWLARLFAAILPPLLHFLYRHGTAFSPHGENAIVVYDANDVPVRLAVKDFVDDVNISDHELPELADLPTKVAGVLLREPPAYLCQFLHGALFVGHFRYLSHLAERRLGVSRQRFWQLVRTEIAAYQRRFPEMANRFSLFDLATPSIDRLCLNRNRLLLDGYRDRPTRPHVEPYGMVANPLADEN